MAIPVVSRLHKKLTSRFSWYDRWHQHRYHKHVHLGILGTVVAVTAKVVIGLVIFGGVAGSALAAPGPVTSISTSTSNQAVNLTWVNPTDVGFNGVHIYRSTASGTQGSLVHTTSSSDTSWSDTGLTNGTAYYYTLLPFDTDGNEGTASGLDSNTKLLLHNDGTNASTTFTDSSSNNTTLISTGSTNSTTQSKFGGSSDSVNGASVYTSGAGSNFALPGDFTIDTWAYFTSSPGDSPILFSGRNQSSNVIFLSVKADGTGLRMGRSGVAEDASANYSWLTNTWYHIALVRSGNTLTFYVNGASIGSASNSISYAAGELAIGGDSGYYFPGYIDEFRVSPGIARWISDFTSPTSAYGANAQYTATPVANGSPATPAVDSPANNYRTQSHTPTLAVTGYSDPDSDTQTATQWQVSTSSNFSSTAIDTGDDTTNLSSYTTSTLSDGLYFWRARFKDSVGNYSNYSIPRSFVVDVTAPLLPTNVIVTGTDGGSTISWTNPTESDFVGIKIYRSTTQGSLGSLVQTTSSSDTSWSDTGLTNGTAYYYTLQPTDSTGNERANTQVGGPYGTDANTVALWHLNETSGTSFTDSSGNSHSASSTGTSGIVAGKYSNGVHMGYGSSAPYDMGYITGSGMPSGMWSSGSVEFWYKPDQDVRSGSYALFNSSDYVGLSIDIWSGALQVGDECGGMSSYSIPSNWNGTWQHIAVTWNGTNTKLYINNALVGTYSNYNNCYSVNDQYYFNSSVTLGFEPENYFYASASGVMDEVRVSNTDRTDFSAINQVRAFPNTATESIASPVGGEHWGLDATNNITWTTGGSGTSKIGLDYSSNGGSTWTSIVTGLTDTGSYAWTPPASRSTNAKIKVTAYNTYGDAIASSVSPSAFTFDGNRPVSPTSIATSVDSGTSHVTTTWTVSADSHVVGNRVYRSTTKGSKGTLLHDFADNTTATYTDTSSSYGVTYYYSVIAYNDVNSESVSNSVDANTLGFWGFNEGSGTTTADGSSNNLTGTLSGASWVSGHEGSALSYNGSSSYVSMGAATPLVVTSDLTMEAWVNPTSYADNIIINKENQYEMGVGASGNIWFAIANSSPGWTGVDTGYNISLNTWTYIAFTYSTSTGQTKLYANGTQVYSAAGSGNIGSNGGPNDFEVGNRQVSNTSGFSGAIDDVRISNIARTTLDLASLQQSTITPSDATVSLTSPTGSEKWKGGSSHNITWSSSGTGIDSAKISYSKDNGSTYSQVAAGLSNSGSYAWTVPRDNSAQVLVKVQLLNAQGSDVSVAVSPATFTIDSTAPASPGSQAVTSTGSGSAQTTVTWTNPGDSDFAGIRVYRSTARYTQGSLLTDISNTSTTSYVDNAVSYGTTYYYSITAYDNVDNESRAASIGGPYDTDANTMLLWHLDEGTGSAVDSSGNNDNYSTSGSVSWATGKYSNGIQTPNSTYFYTTSLPNANNWMAAGTLEFWYKPSVDLRSNSIGIIGGDNTSYSPRIHTQSDGKLYLGSGNNNGGVYTIPADWTDTWLHMAMTWNSTNTFLYINNVLVGTYSAGNGNAYYMTGRLNVGYDNNWGNYGRGIYDEVRLSNVARTDFTIGSQVSITLSNATVSVTSPIGGEKWAGSSSHNITWSGGGDGVNSVKTYLSSNSGTSYSQIASGLPNTGSYSWTLPSINTTQARVKVEALNSQGDVLAFSESPADFTVDSTPPAIPSSQTIASTGSGTAQVTLSWSNPTDTDFTGIKIYRSTTLNSQGSLIYNANNTTTTNYVDNGVDLGTTYYYSITSYDDISNESSWNHSDANTVGVWNFNEGTSQTLADATGNGHGAVLGASSSAASDDPTWSAGKYGAGLTFDGSNDYATTTANIGTTGSQARTLEAWIKTSVTTRQAIAGWGTTSGGGVFDLEITGGCTAGTINIVGYNADLCSSTVVSDGSWHHVAATYDGTNEKLYVDGSLVATGAASLSTGNSAMEIGRQIYADSGDYHYFNGSIDGVRVSDVARTSFVLTNPDQLLVTPNDTSTTLTTQSGGQQYAGGSSQNITWTNTGSGIDSVRLSYSSDSGANYAQIVAGQAVNSTYSWTVPTLNSTHLRIKVEALNAQGNLLSQAVSAADFTIDSTAPASPTAMTASPGSGQVVVSWLNPTDTDFAGVDIYRSTTSGTKGSKVHTTGASDTNWTDTGLSNGTTYYYALESFDTLGNTRPAAAIGGPYVADANTMLLWHLDEGTGSAVDSSGNNDNYSTSGSVSWTTGKYGSGIQTPNSTFFYTSSLPSNWMSTGTLDFWYKPSVDLRSNSIGVIGGSNTCWSPRVHTQADGNLYIGSGCGGSGTYSIPADWTNTWVHMAMTWNGTNTFLYINNTLVGTYSAGNGNSYYIDGALYVGYDNNWGNYGRGVYDEVRFSNIARTDFTALSQTSAAPNDSTSVLTTQNSGEIYVGGSSHNISWTSSGTDIDNVQLFYSTDSGTSYSQIVSGQATSGSYSWTVPLVDTTHALVKVIVLNSQGDLLSQAISATTFTIDSTSPAAPTSVTATPSVSGVPKVTLGWTNPSDADLAGINIYRSTSSGVQGSLIHATNSSSTTSYIDTTTSPSTTYYYTVTAYDLAGKESQTADAFTKLLLHGDGSNGSTTIVDSSPSQHTVSRYGTGVTVSTAQSKFGGASIGSTGAANGFTVPATDDFTFGSGDFTVDTWIYFNSHTLYTDIFEVQNTSGSSYIQLDYNPNSGTIDFGSNLGSGGSIMSSYSWSPSNSQWYHLALVRSGDTWSFYINGTSVRTGTAAITFPAYDRGLEVPHIGSNGSWGLDGYLDEYRVSKGVARWTSNFTPPTASYGASQVSATTPANLPPGNPTSVTATPGAGSVTLNWANSSDDDLAGVNVYRSTTQGLLGSLISGETPVTGTEYVDSTATPGTAYYYVVKEVDAIGQESLGTTQTWTSQADWGNWTLSSLDSSTTSGDLKLSGGGSPGGVISSSATVSMDNACQGNTGYQGLVDGDLGTWISNCSDSAPITLTWGSSQTIQKVRYGYGGSWYNGPATQVTFSYYNGSTWITPTEWSNKSTGIGDPNSSSWSPYLTLTSPVTTSSIRMVINNSFICQNYGACGGYGYDTGDIEVTAGSLYSTPGTASIAYDPDGSNVKVWANPAVSSTTPTGTSLTTEYSSDGATWFSSLAGIDPTGTINIRHTLAATDASKTPAVHDTSISYFSQVSATPLSAGSTPATPNVVSPADGYRTVTNPALSINGYSNSDSSAQAATQWIVSSHSDFSSPSVNTGDDSTHLSSYTPTASLSDGTYYWKARFKAESGTYSAYSTARTFVIDTTAPGLVSSLSPTPGSAAISLSWTNPTDSDFDHVNIYRTTSPGVTAIIGSKIGTSTSTSYNDSGLTNGTTYYYALTSVDALGNESTLSTEVSSAPVAVTATVTSPSGSESWKGGSSHNITWSTTGTGISTVSLYYSTNGGSSYGNTIATGEANDGSYSWTVASIDSSTVKVKVELRDGSGNVLAFGTSSSSFAIDSTAPTFSSLSASSNNSNSSSVAKSGNTVTLIFNTSETLSGNPTVTLGTKAMTYSSLSTSTYTYTRVLDGSETEGSASIAISGSDVAGNGGNGSGSFTLDFTAPNAPTVTAPATTVTVHAASYTVTGSAEANALVQVYQSSSVVASQQLSGGATSYSISTPLTANSANTFTVKSSDLAGNQSSAANVSTITEDSSIPASPTISLPSGAISTNATTYSVTGSAPANSLVKIYRSSSSIASQQLSGGATSFSISVTLTTNAANILTATSTNGVGTESGATSVPTITQDSVVPGAPTSSSATVSDSQATLHWTNAVDSDLDHVNVYRSDSAGFTPGPGNKVGQSANASATSWTDSSVTNGTTYYYKLISEDQATNLSSPTSAISATPNNLVVTVSSPSGSEVWKGGSSHNITWSLSSSSGVSSINLYYSTNGGSSFASIASGQSNTGSYSWTVPSTNTSSALVKIEALDSTGTVLNFGTSAASFTIDSTAPVFSSLSASSNNSNSSSVAKSGNTVTLIFNTSETLSGNPTVTLGTKAMTYSSLSTSTYTYTRVLDGSETEGSASIAISGSDVAGNQGTASTTFTTDFTAPSAPSVTAPATTVTVHAANYTITGSAEANALVQVYRSSSVIASQQLSSGATSYSISAPLSSNAANNLTVTSSDVARNESSTASVPVITQDSVAPSAPSVTAPSGTVTTNAASYTVAGSSEANSLVKIYRSGSVVANQQLSGGATSYSISVTLAANSVNTLTVTSSDAAANESSTASVPTITQDSVAPSAPSVTAPGTALTTKNSTYTITGSAEANALVQIYLSGSVISSQQLTGGDTSFSISTSLSTDAVNNLTVKATDAANNQSIAANVPAITQDSTAPAVPTSVSVAPGDTQNVIHWINPVDSDFDHVAIYRSTSAGVAINSGNRITTSTATSYSDNGLTNGTAYYYVITSLDSVSNESTGSTEVSGTPITVTATVTSPNGGESWNGSSNKNITWTTTGNNINSVNLYYSTDGGSTYSNTIVTGEANDGSYSWTVPSLNSTTLKVKVELRDGSGNVMAFGVSSTAFTIDSVAPTLSALSASSNNANSSVIAKVGNTVTVTFHTSETLTSNPTVTLGTKVMSYVSLSSSNYTYTRLLDGSETEGASSPITVSGSDVAGNAGSTSGSFGLDFTAPSAPSVVAPEGPVTVNAANYTITGSAEANAIVKIYQSSSVVASQQLTAGATAYSISAPLTENSANSFTVTATDLAGNQSSSSNVPVVTEDSTAAESPVISSPSTTVKVNASTYSIVGTAAANTLVKIYRGGSSVASQQLTGGATSFSISVNLLSNADNNFSATVTNGVGQESASTVVPTITQDSIAPAAPSGLYTASGDSQVTLHWTNAVDSDLDHVNIYRATTSSFTPGAGNKIGQSANASAQAWTDSTVTNGTIYYYKLISEDQASNLSSTTGSVSAIPNNVVVTVTSPTGSENWAGGSSHSVTWSLNNSNGVSAVNIYYSPNSGTSYSLITSGEANDGSYSWTTPMINSTNVLVKVEVVDSLGDVLNYSTSSTTFTIDSVIPTLNNISATSNTGKSVARVGDVITLIFNTSEALSANPTVSLGTKAMTYVSLSGSTYTYRRTLDGSETEGSASISIAVADTANNIGSASTVFSTDFTSPSAPVVSSPSSSAVTNASSYLITGTAEANSLVKIYRSGSVVASQQLSGGATAYSISTGLTSNADNSLTVTSTDTAGNESSAANIPVIAQDAVAPSTPTVASPSSTVLINSASYTVSGTADAGTLVSVIRGGSVVASQQLSTGVTAYSISVPLAANSVNHLTVTATDAAGNQSFAATVPAITEDSIGPFRPTFVTAVPSDGVITLNWVNPGDSDYNHTSIYRSTTSGFTPSDANKVYQTTSTSITSYVDDSLTNGTAYYYDLISFDNIANQSSVAGVPGCVPNSVVLSLNSPVGGEQWQGSENHAISWTITGVGSSSASLYYSVNNGASYSLITSGQTGSSYNWQTPAVTSSYVKIKVESFDLIGNVIASVESGSSLSITTPTVTTTNTQPTLATPATTKPKTSSITTTPKATQSESTVKTTDKVTPLNATATVKGTTVSISLQFLSTALIPDNVFVTVYVSADPSLKGRALTTVKASSLTTLVTQTSAVSGVHYYYSLDVAQADGTISTYLNVADVVVPAASSEADNRTALLNPEKPAGILNPTKSVAAKVGSTGSVVGISTGVLVFAASAVGASSGLAVQAGSLIAGIQLIILGLLPGRRRWGRAIENGTGLPVVGATIVVSDVRGDKVGQAVTDRLGNFSLAVSRAGIYRISIVSDEYKSQVFSINVTDPSKPINPVILPLTATKLLGSYRNNISRQVTFAGKILDKLVTVFIAVGTAISVYTALVTHDLLSYVLCGLYAVMWAYHFYSSLLTSSVSGAVVDQSSNQPLTHATITFFKHVGNTGLTPVRSVSTDNQGRYKARIKPGQYLIRVDHPSYSFLQQNSIKVALFKSQIEDIHLQPESVFYGK